MSFCSFSVNSIYSIRVVNNPKKLNLPVQKIVGLLTKTDHKGNFTSFYPSY